MSFKTRAKNTKDNWRTPKYLFDYLNLKYHFNIDLAADDNNHLCNDYYTEETDALKQDWTGKRAFCNPPFSQKKVWIKKAAETVKMPEKNTIIVMIIPATVETEAWRKYIWNGAYEIIFPAGRVKYIQPDGTEGGSPAFPTAIIVWKSGYVGLPYVTGGLSISRGCG